MRNLIVPVNQYEAVMDYDFEIAEGSGKQKLGRVIISFLMLSYISRQMVAL